MASAIGMALPKESLGCQFQFPQKRAVEGAQQISSVHLQGCRQLQHDDDAGRHDTTLNTANHVHMNVRSLSERFLRQFSRSA